MTDLLTYKAIAQAMNYKDTRIVRKLIKQGVLTPVHVTPNSRPRIHVHQWQAYVQQLNPQTQVEPLDVQQDQNDLLALMNHKETNP